MIDRNARNKYAEHLRMFVSGQLTNFEYENGTPDSQDRAIREIDSSIWCFYDDFKKHRLNGDWALPKETKAVMARWIVFLYSDIEYQWPPISYAGVRPIKYGIFGKLFQKDKRQQLFMEFGDYSVWPFIDQDSYLTAKRSPVLLAGKSDR